MATEGTSLLYQQPCPFPLCHPCPHTLHTHPHACTQHTPNPHLLDQHGSAALLVVDGGVYPRTEHVLVVLRIYTRAHQHAVVGGVAGLAWWGVG